jgi:WD40 repeat protein
LLVLAAQIRSVNHARVLASTGLTRTNCISSDGSLLATGSHTGRIAVFRVSDSEPISRIAAHKEWVVSVAFSPDSQLLASVGTDGTARLWRVNTGELIANLPSLGEFGYAADFSPDGTQIAAVGFGDWNNMVDMGSGGVVCLFDVESRNELQRLVLDQTPFSVAFSPDGQRLVIGLYRSEFQVFDVASGLDRLLSIRHGDEASYIIWNVDFTADGSQIATSGWNDVKLWDSTTGAMLRRFGPVEGSIRAMHVSTSGELIAAGTDKGELHIWNVGNGERLQVITAYDEWQWGFAFSPDGRSLLTANQHALTRWPIDR